MSIGGRGGGGTYIVALDVNLGESNELVCFLDTIILVVVLRAAIHQDVNTGLVCTTSFKVRFIHVSH